MKIKSDKTHFFVSALKTANENDRIYDPFGIANTDDVALTVQQRPPARTIASSGDSSGKKRAQVGY